MIIGFFQFLEFIRYANHTAYGTASGHNILLNVFRSHCNPTPIPTAKLYLKCATSSSIGHENYNDTLQGGFSWAGNAHMIGGVTLDYFWLLSGYNCFFNLSLFCISENLILRHFCYSFSLISLKLCTLLIHVLYMCKRLVRLCFNNFTTFLAWQT